MQLASQGVLATARTAAQIASKPTSRAIHMPSFSRIPRGAPSAGTAQRIFNHSKTLFGRFVANLTAPSTLRQVPSVGRSLHAANGAASSIQSGMSLPNRITLSRPLHAPFLPRPPAIPRTTTQVGLGTARNFSSSRPIFQNLVQNVPIAGRAFLEADWDIKMHEEKAKMMAKKQKRSKENKGSKQMMKPKAKVAQLTTESTIESATAATELDLYFPASAPEVTTYLLIPLAPTPTARLPLSPSPPAHVSLLPLESIRNLHADHSTHSARVSSLFARLDNGNVWGKGVSCGAYSHGGGLCTVLKVEFKGWRADEVRSVIGESGTGWCVMEEVRTGTPALSVVDDLSDASSMISESRDELDHWQETTEFIDPSQSFVLPTLDFSSQFIEAQASAPASLSYAYSSDHESDSDSLSDPGSDFSDHSSSWVDAAPSVSSRSGVGSAWLGFGFSSDFASRAMAEEYEPRERAF